MNFTMLCGIAAISCGVASVTLADAAEPSRKGGPPLSEKEDMGTRTTEAPRYVVVASYGNDPAGRKVGDRAAAILSAKGIKCVAAGSASMSLNVFASRETEARRELAKAVIAEGLRMDLLEMNAKGDRALIVTPQSVLARGAEK